MNLSIKMMQKLLKKKFYLYLHPNFLNYYKMIETTSTINVAGQSTLSPNAGVVIAHGITKLLEEMMSQPTEAEKQHKAYLDELSQYLVDVEKDYGEDEVIAKISDVNAFGRKDLVCIKAKQKNGKTHFIAILLAAMLRESGRWNEVLCMLKKLNILVVDTEQKKRDTQLIIRKAMNMANLKIMNLDNLKVLNLRDVASADECYDRVAQAIENLGPDVVFIDGVVDLSSDFNDITSSQQLVRNLMKLADDGNCCIISVIHTNKSADDHNMRGHLGTILSQKASCVFECRKDTKTNIVQVSCTDCRHAPIPDFFFGFDQHGDVVSMTKAASEIKAREEEQKLKKKAAAEEAKLQERYAKVKEILNVHSGLLASSSLRKAIEDGKILSKNYISDFLNILVARGLLTISSDSKTYSLPKDDENRYADSQCRLGLE